MKKIALYLLTTVTALSCSNAQNKEFSEESLSKKIISIDNKEISFSEILKKHNGKVTVIEVWASWCSDCVKAMPKVKEMQTNNPNVDYVFILREPYMNNRKRLFENYGSAFPSFELFCQMMDQCTQNYECLVINNNAKSNKLNDQIFWYKAENHPDFKLGSKEFWEISKGMGSDDEDEAYDPNKGKKRKPGSQITVKKSKW